MPADDRRKFLRPVNLVVVHFMLAILRDILFICH